jgi:hypothetical protein
MATLTGFFMGRSTPERLHQRGANSSVFGAVAGSMRAISSGERSLRPARRQWRTIQLIESAGEIAQTTLVIAVCAKLFRVAKRLAVL